MWNFFINDWKNFSNQHHLLHILLKIFTNKRLINHFIKILEICLYPSQKNHYLGLQRILLKKKIAFFAFREYLTINFVHVTLHQSLPSFFMCSCLKERFGDEGKERICASRKFSPSKKQQKNELLFSQNKIVYLETHSYWNHKQKASFGFLDYRPKKIVSIVFYYDLI